MIKQEALAAALSANKAQASQNGAGTSTVTQKGSGDAPILSARTQIDHVLSVYRNGEWLRSIPLPNQPTTIEVGKTPAVSLRRTLGRLPIRQHSQDRVWDITFQGMVGIANRPYRTAGGADSALQGLDILNEFDAFLAAYQELAETEGSLYLTSPDQSSAFTQRTYLVYSDFHLGISYLVEQARFDYGRGLSTRVGNASWSLRLQVYGIHNKGQTARLGGGYARRMPSTKPAALRNPLKEKLLKGMDTGLPTFNKDAVSQAVSLLSQRVGSGIFSAPLDGYVEALGKPYSTSLLSQGTLSKIAVLRGHVSSFNEALRRIQLRIDEVKDVVKLPFTLVADVVNSGNKVLGVLNDIRDTGYHFMEDYSHLGTSLKNLAAFSEGAVAAMTSLFGAIGGSYRYLRTSNLDAPYNAPMSGVGMGAASAVSPQDDLPDTATVSTYVVCPGDTWPSIALKFFGSPDAWLFVASYNGAADAYSLSDGSPLAAGATVYIPGAPSSGILAAPANPADLYGSCLAFDFLTGDLVLADAEDPSGQLSLTERTGFAKAEGAANLRQSIIHRMLTVRGELPYDPGYGIFSSAPGNPIDGRSLVSGVAEIAEQLRKDPRVANVTNVSLVMQADKLTAQFSVTATGGSQVSLVAPLK